MVSKVEQLCVEKGIKITGQRKVLAKVISEASDHPDVEEIHKRASKIDNRISIPTVYRTVRLFEEMGIIEKHDFKDGRARYEGVSEENHYHLIDLRSGKVIEFKDSQIQEIKEKIAKKLGYKLVDYRIELYGVPFEEN